MTGVHRSEAWLQAQLSKGRPPQKALSTKTAAVAAGSSVVQSAGSANPETRVRIPPQGPKLATEHQIQAAFVQWCRLNETRLPALKLAFAVPNGRKRTKAEAGMLKAEGVRAGVPDWWLPWPRIGNYEWSGLVIEFKSVGGYLSKAQNEYLVRLQEAGWRWETCRSVESAIKTVEAYLS